MAEKKREVPSYWKLIKEGVCKPSEVARVVDGNVYTVDTNSSDFKKAAAARMEKRRVRMKAKMAKVRVRAEKKALGVLKRAQKLADKEDTLLAKAAEIKMQRNKMISA